MIERQLNDAGCYYAYLFEPLEATTGVLLDRTAAELGSVAGRLLEDLSLEGSGEVRPDRVRNIGIEQSDESGAHHDFPASIRDQHGSCSNPSRCSTAIECLEVPGPIAQHLVPIARRMVATT
jgi:hypothetical protein